MSPKKASGCGCSSVPISLIILILGGGYWWFIHLGHLNISKLLPNKQETTAPQTPTVPEANGKIANSLPTVG